jgi:hypothetical protein
MDEEEKRQVCVEPPAQSMPAPTAEETPTPFAPLAQPWDTTPCLPGRSDAPNCNRPAQGDIDLGHALEVGVEAGHGIHSIVEIIEHGVLPGGFLPPVPIDLLKGPRRDDEA